MRGKTVKRLRKAAMFNTLTSSDPQAEKKEYKRLKRAWKNRNKS